MTAYKCMCQKQFQSFTSDKFSLRTSQITILQEYLVVPEYLDIRDMYFTKRRDNVYKHK